MEFVTAYLDPLIHRLEEVAGQTGNCGRKVRRTLEQVFSFGDGQGAVCLPLVGAEQLSALGQFQVLDRMDRAAQMANVAMAGVAEGCQVEIRLASLENVHGEPEALFGFQVRPGIPSGVKAQQALLRQLAYGLRRVLAMAEMFSLKLDTAYLVELFDDVVLTPEVLRKYVSQAERLAEGDTSEEETTPIILVGLMERLQEVKTLPVKRHAAANLFTRTLAV